MLWMRNSHGGTATAMKTTSENKTASTNAIPTVRAFAIVRDLVIPHTNAIVISLCLMTVGQLARLFFPFSSKYLVDTIVLRHNFGQLPWLAFAILLTSVIHSVCYFFGSHLLSNSSEHLIVTTRTKVQSHIASLPVAYFDSYSTGILVSRIMSDVEGLRNLIGQPMLEVFIAVITAFLAFLVLVHKSSELSWLIVGTEVIACIGIHQAFSYCRPIARAGARIRAEVTGRLTETIGGIRVVKGYGSEDSESKIFEQGAKRLCANAVRSRLGSNWIMVTGTITTSLTTTLVAFIGGRLMIRGYWTTGDYIQYTAMSLYLVGPMYQLVHLSTQVTQAVAALDRIDEVMTQSAEDSEPTRSIKLPTLAGHIVLDNVKFSYVAGRTVLHDITFTAPPGTVTALVGSSGSGKSTLIALLAAFYSPTSGRITIDGIDLKTAILNSYRMQLGLVLQESFLFEGTIRDNVLFSRPSTSNERFLDACHISCVDEFAERLPDGYDTIVGERGVKLSGGQRQRISIARAIVANPRILILDEATSSLDSESEAMIQEGLNYLMVGRTTIVIAHRLSTIRRADQILVIEAGVIVERGNHGSLYDQRGRYYELYTRQYGLESNLFLAPFEGANN